MPASPTSRPAVTRLPSDHVVLSLGMGVDSVALLVRWIMNPSTRDFPLNKLVVVTAMTGEEHPRTREYMERYLLPLLRAHRIRYVQLCRAGQLKAAGYVVLSDSRDTQRMIMRGPWWLSMEMRAAGTLPSMRNGRRWCSERAKGQVLDAWVADHMEPGYIHVVGFAAEERRRATRDTAARRDKERRREVPACVPFYPLILWRWDRQRCQDFLTRQFDLEEPWPRSCCTFCPFSATAGGRPELIARWRAQPAAAADAIELEYTALALNPQIGAFGVDRTAHDLARQAGIEEAMAIAARRIQQRPDWVLLEVRRFFTAGSDRDHKGFAWRSVSIARTGTREQMLAAARAQPRTELEVDEYGITRAWRHRRPAPDTPVHYPLVEWMYVVVPAGVQAKKRPGFEPKWAGLIADGLF